MKPGWFAAILILAPAAAGAATSISMVQPPAGQVGRYEKYELSFALSRGYANPYDPSEADVYAQFESPTGRKFRVNAFPYQDFRRILERDKPLPPDHYSRSYSPSEQVRERFEAVGAGAWKCRFAADETGSWSGRLFVRDSAGLGEGPVFRFQVQPSGNPGFIRISKKDPLYFATDDGKPWFGIGQNLGWGDAWGTFGFDRWLSSIAAEGGNLVRVWMAPWSFLVEWGGKGLGNYGSRQQQAWALDHVFEQSEKNGIKIMLCLINHGAFSSKVNPNWKDNPYNKALGGPLEKPEEVWSNPEAQKLMTRRWRYIVARWAYSTALQSWEFWNEMEWVDGFEDHQTQAAKWHEIHGAQIRALDPHRHLITSSTANFPGNPEIWSKLDFTQGHVYGSTDLAATGKLYTTEMIRQNKRPYLFGEYGIDGNGFEMSLHDPKGLSIHDMQWACLMSKAASSGMAWYWDIYIDPARLYFNYRGISNFLKGETLDGEEYQSVSPKFATQIFTDLNINPGFNVWAQKPTASSFEIGENGEVTPGTDGLRSYQYAEHSNNQYRNPPAFKVRYAKPGKFKVHIVEASDSGAQASILLDGKRVAQLDFKGGRGDAWVEADISAGAHEIKVDSTGRDWYRVASYTFSNYTGILRGYALQGPRRILGWVQSRNHTFHGVDAGWPQPEIKDGVISFEGVRAGAWTVEWWDATAGKPLSRQGLQAADGSLRVKVPPLRADYAFKIWPSK